MIFNVLIPSLHQVLLWSVANSARISGQIRLRADWHESSYAYLLRSVEASGDLRFENESTPAGRVIRTLDLDEDV